MEGRSSGEAARHEAVGDADAGGVLERERAAELTDTHSELREQLQKAKDDCNMARGAISSLQRQLEIQESRLRGIKSEKEMLQKKLRERETQLQAMSTKFCSLREERKHEEMMVTIEKENCSLRQVVAEQEHRLAEQDRLISELQGTVSRLQAEVLSGQHHLHKQQRAQAAIQSQAETLEHRELQTRVALERITSRYQVSPQNHVHRAGRWLKAAVASREPIAWFERYRSKIIQATFSAAGSKPPQAEVTDEEVLEAMQKIINERMEFYQMLKQKGIKVPSLHSIDTPALSPTSVKGRRKSPAR